MLFRCSLLMPWVPWCRGKDPISLIGVAGHRRLDSGYGKWRNGQERVRLRQQADERVVSYCLLFVFSSRSPGRSHLLPAGGELASWSMGQPGLGGCSLSKRGVILRHCRLRGVDPMASHALTVLQREPGFFLLPRKLATTEWKI